MLSKSTKYVCVLFVARGSGRVGEGDDRVAVLRRVLRELLAGQLTGAPALVEGMVENVPARSRGFDSGDDVQQGLLGDWRLRIRNRKG